jgi:hypothetical protein
LGEHPPVDEARERRLETRSRSADKLWLVLLARRCLERMRRPASQD